MIYPKLVLKQYCTTEIEVIVETEEISEEGAPIEALRWNGKCNYQDNAKSVLTADKKLIQLSGTAYIHFDIAPDLPTISGGKAVVNGVERTIYQGMKARNPDGTVNYVRIDLV